PRQALICLGREGARRLCDTDDFPQPKEATLRGGREWHNEYCEYRVILRPDGDRQRPKRAEITTELRDYWLCLARERPDRLLPPAREVLVTPEHEGDPEPTVEALYGGEPRATRDARERQFVAQTAGSETQSDRIAPAGPLNRDRALFLCHPINGLDDLFFI